MDGCLITCEVQVGAISEEVVLIPGREVDPEVLLGLGPAGPTKRGLPPALALAHKSTHAQGKMPAVHWL